MKLYRSIKKVKKIAQGSIVAVGIFDGVHRGHAYIIKMLTKRAKRLNKKSVALTFSPHPSSVIHPKKAVPLLSSLQHRLQLFEKLGVDIAVIIRFDKEVSLMKPEVFIEKFLVNKLNIKEMLVSDNFTFGSQGAGDIWLLERLSGKYGFRIKKLKLLKDGKRVISSTHIRRLIMKGKLKNATNLLGRPVSILGTVKGGTRIGRALGFPTANIDPHHEAIPPSGVYAVRVRFEKRLYGGILNIGFKPTFTTEDYTPNAVRYLPEPTIEVHIFNFKRNIYGKNLEIIFYKRLRPEKRFEDREALKRRIMLDEKLARKILSK